MRKGASKVLDFIEAGQDVWQTLQLTDKPVVLYGMGNGADQIIDWCDSHKVEVAGVFASDEFVRGQVFRGHRVETYDAVKERLEDFLLVIAFASESPAVLQRFQELSLLHETVAPHLPLFPGDETVSFDWLQRHQQELQQIYDKLADDWSRKVFAAALNYKLSGKLHYLWQSDTERLEDLQNIFSWSETETYADLGAYNGDTIREFLQLTHSKYNKIFAAEPDRRNYKKLAAYVEASGLTNIKIFERAIWKECTELSFSDSGGRQSTLLAGQRRTVQAADIDTLLQGERATYIKMDVEGAELEALAGGSEQIRLNRPKLFIAAYHHDVDMFLLPLFLWRLVPEYKVYLRKHPYVPAWELNFLVTL